MAYASVEDMVARFGMAEMVRATTPDGAAAEVLIPEPIRTALDDASAQIDTFLRKRYQVPLDIAPAEIRRACCMLARYDLALGGQREASEQTRNNREEAITWLRSIAKGEVVLDLAEVAPGEESYATLRTRRPAYSDDGAAAGGCFEGGFWNGGWP